MTAARCACLLSRDLHSVFTVIKMLEPKFGMGRNLSISLRKKQRCGAPPDIWAQDCLRVQGNILGFSAMR